ncbi:MAG: choice-of-anchor B family protein [Planctomycetota bacterium]
MPGFFTNGNQAIGHNLYTKDGKIYAANYTSGVRIFDYASNPSNPQEIGFFDSYPDSDAATFNGLWSVFPYFPSGIMIGSDLERGLFVWYAGDQQLDIQVVGGAPTQISPGGETLTICIDAIAPAVLDLSSPVLVYDLGSGAVTVPLTSLGGNQYSADLPANTCGNRMAWYVQAYSTISLPWYGPADGPAAPYRSRSA